MKCGIKEVSELTGVSARTLRYYDQIGLLKPSKTSEAGYRYYGERELEILQQILFYKERGMELKQIKKIIYQKDFDIMAALREHLLELEEKRNHMEALIQTVEQTIRSMKGEYDMSDQEKFQAFRQILQQEVEHIFYFRNVRELELTVRMNMTNMLIRYPALGWVRPQNTQALNDEIAALKEKIKGLEGELEQKIPDPFLNVRKVTSQDTFDFEYQLHAYQDGNFKELKLNRQMTWLEILQLLFKVFKNQTPEEYFSIRINDYLNETGLKDAQVQMPRAHAVARSQINFRALHNIKHQLKQSDWITPVGRDDRQRVMWQFTEKGKNLLKKMTASKNA